MLNAIPDDEYNGLYW